MSQRVVKRWKTECLDPRLYGKAWVYLFYLPCTLWKKLQEWRN